MTVGLTDASTPSLLLAQTAFFRDLSARQIQQVAALGSLQHFKERQEIYRISEPAVAIYVLVHGSVRLSIGLGGRDTGTGDILRRGEVFGWAALTPSCKLRIGTASCVTPCSLLSIDGERLTALMEQDHSIGYRVMSQLNRLITGTLTSFVGG